MYITYLGEHRVSLRWEHLTQEERRKVMERQQLRDRIADGYMEAWEITGGHFIRKENDRIVFVETVVFH